MISNKYDNNDIINFELCEYHNKSLIIRLILTIYQENK